MPDTDHFNIRNRYARKRTEPRCGNVQRKERRHGRDDGVPKRLRDLGAGDRAGTAGGEQQSIAGNMGRDGARPSIEGRPPCVHINWKPPPLRPRLDSCAREKSHARRFRFVQQAIDDRARRICHRKHASVRFGLEPDAVRFEPRDGVARRESMERRDEGAFTSRIMLAQRPRIEAGMGDVAASATGNPDLRQKLRAAFEDGYFIFRIGPRAGDCGEESRRASADDCDLPWHT